MEKIRHKFGRFMGSKSRPKPASQGSAETNQDNFGGPKSQSEPATTASGNSKGRVQDRFGGFQAPIGSKSQAGPATKPSSDNDLRSKAIRERAERFRVLVIGRANAGKTTILQKVCNTAEQPEIFDSEGNKIDTSVVSPTELRGIHDIKNELVFQSNPGFIFHDSRGFEAGGVAELNTVKKFVEERSKGMQLSSQLHVIWYCIPMDDERPFTAAELSFFSKCGTGRIPVVAIFTKFDALEDKAYGDLEIEGCSHEDAVAQAPARAVADFEKQHLPHLYGQNYPPKGHVYLRDMNKPETDCRELTQTVAAVLDNNNLQRLFVSTQRSNLELCMKYAVQSAFTPEVINMHQPITSISTEFQVYMLRWYPHFLYGRRGMESTIEHSLSVRLNADTHEVDVNKRIDPWGIRSADMQSKMFPFIGPLPIAQQIARLGVALAIIAEHSYYLWDRAPSTSIDYLISAVDVYESSAKHTAVTEAVDETFKEDEGRLFKEAESSEDPKESAFAKRLLQIALDNRLPTPQ